jgi:hypothetical protein
MYLSCLSAGTYIPTQERCIHTSCIVLLRVIAFQGLCVLSVNILPRSNNVPVVINIVCTHVYSQYIKRSALHALKKIGVYNC